MENKSTFKQDISSLNKSNFEENGIIIIYEDYIRIENSLFTQNLTFDVINEVISEESNVWSILLENNEKIMLRFDNKISDLELLFAQINYKISNQEQVVYDVMCKVRFNRNLLYSLGNFLKKNRTLENNNMINEFINLKVFDTHLNIENNNLELDIPYDYFKNLNLSNNYSLELILMDNGNIFLDDIHLKQVNEITEFIGNKIAYLPVYNNQTQPTTFQQQSNNQYSTNQNMNSNAIPPINKKSKIVGLILNMLVVGLGYAYVGKWGEAIILFVTYSILIFFGILLSIFLIGFLFILIAIILWIYTLFKTNEMIDKYNQGLPY